MVDVARRIAAVGAAVFALVGVLVSDPGDLGIVAAGVAVVVLVAWLDLRHVEGRPLLAGLVVGGALVALVCSGQPSNLGWFGVCALAAWAALVLPVPVAGSAAGLAMLNFVGQWLWLDQDPGWGAWIAGTVFSSVACMLLRRQQGLLEQLREAQAGLAERTRAEERNRIAHELHDVIGHALTVSLLHISSARLALEEDPDEAAAALAEAERLGQQSLADVRAVVGLMKDPSSAAPLPGADQIDELVESFRRAGTQVSCAVVGDLTRLTATEGLTVYRILQEALTNIARHAPGSAADVLVEVAEGGTRIQVDSAGAPARASAGGAGVAGMRERAEAMGGVLTAGPSGSGWRVEAVLPQ